MLISTWFITHLRFRHLFSSADLNNNLPFLVESTMFWKIHNDNWFIGRSRFQAHKIAPTISYCGWLWRGWWWPLTMTTAMMTKTTMMTMMTMIVVGAIWEDKPICDFVSNKTHSCQLNIIRILLPNFVTFVAYLHFLLLLQNISCCLKRRGWFVWATLDNIFPFEHNPNLSQRYCYPYISLFGIWCKSEIVDVYAQGGVLFRNKYHYRRIMFCKIYFSRYFITFA